MSESASLLRNLTDPGPVGHALGSSARPTWAIALLASILIFTTVVDVVGNFLVIISVFRNRKLRNAGSPVTTVTTTSTILPLLQSACVLFREPGGRNNSNYLKAKPISYNSAYRLCITSMVVEVCSLPSSGRLLGATVSIARLCSMSNAFVVSLALADLIVAFYPYPLVLYALFHDGWSLGDTQCMVSGFLMGLSVIGSVFNITGIAVNRYCYICHSFTYGRLYSSRNTLLLVALTWTLTVLAILPNLFVGSLSYDPRVYSCTFTQTTSSSYTVAVVVVHFLVPIAVVTFCYLRIWVLVIQVRHKARSSERQSFRPSDLRDFLTMFVVFVLFAVCWAPLNLIGLVVASDPEVMAPRIPEWLFVTSYFMAYFNSCLNAIVYGLLNRNFRKEYKRIVTSVWMPRLFMTETSRAATDGVRSKPSPGVIIND